MAKKTLIVVHGMGQHTEDSVRAEVVGACERAFALYTSLQGKRPEDQFDILPVEYNSFFDDYRAALADRSDDVLQALSTISGSAPPPARLVREIAGLENRVKEDDFFATHWLDVLLYRFSLFAEPIRLKVAEAIGTAVRDAGATNVHVLGHSLGTAVVHDTLAKAYGPEPLERGGRSLKLSNRRDRLGGVHMVANVSRVLESFRSVDASEVRPGIGCCSVFAEYRHRLDPFTKVRPFDPTDNEAWIPHAVWRSAYRLVEPTSVTDVNVHGLGHYLRNPLVHLPLFRLLFGFRPGAQERDAGSDAYLAGTVRAKADALTAAVENLDFSERSVRELLAAGTDFKDLVTSFEEAF